MVSELSMDSVTMSSGLRLLVLAFVASPCVLHFPRASLLDCFQLFVASSVAFFHAGACLVFGVSLEDCVGGGGGDDVLHVCQFLHRGLVWLLCLSNVWPCASKFVLPPTSSLELGHIFVRLAAFCGHVRPFERKLQDVQSASGIVFLAFVHL